VGASGVIKGSFVRVPTGKVLGWLANDWSRSVPRRNCDMPLDPQPTEWGLRLRFIACPSDSIEVRVTPVAPGNQGCIVACRRGEGAKAALGVMGPQIASLIRASELELHNRLEYDLRAAFPSAVSPVTVNLDAATGTLMSGGPKSKQHTDYAADAEVVTEAAPKAAAPEGPKLPRYDGSDDDEARAQEAAAEEEHQVEPSPEEEEEEDPLESLELPEALRAVDPKDLDAPSRAVKALGDAALREADAAAGKRRPAQGAVSSESSEAAAASDEEEEVMLLKAIAQDSGADSLDLSVPKTFRDAVVETARAANLTDEKVAELFRRGASFASETGQALVASGRAGDRAGALAEGRVEVADKELVRLRVAFEGSQLEGGVDLFDGPKQPSGGPNGAGGSGAGLVDGSAAGTARAAKRYAAALNVSGALPGSPEASAAARGLAFSFFKPHVADPSTLESAEDRRALEATRRSLGRIVRELARPGGNDTLFYPIMSTYRDVVLSEWYPSAMRTLLEANSDPEDQETRKLLALINDYALTCAEELGSVMATSERAQLEKIRQICQVAMDDMQKLPAFVRSMRPALDRDLVAYLGYAVDSERNAIEAKFLDPDREPSQWLQVLGLVRQGVHAELVKDLREDIKSIM